MPAASRNHDGEIRSFVKLSKAMVACIDGGEDRKVTLGLLMDGIFQRKHYHTGFASQEANSLPSAKGTVNEHFFGRRKSAEELIDMLLENPDMPDDEVFNFVKERCQVHTVTKKQNMDLRNYNNSNPDATWSESYEACGIILEPKIDRRKLRKKMVDNTQLA